MKTKLFLVLIFSLLFVNNQLFSQVNLTLLNTYDIGGSVPEPSGLAFDKVNNQLFTVSDSNNIYRLSITGNLLSTYNFSGDLEGVSMYNSPNTILIAIEDEYKIIEYNYVTGSSTPHTMSYTNMGSASSGIEGVTYNPTTGEIYFLNEKSPGALIVANSSFNVTNEYPLNFAGDFSASYFVEETGVLWIGSDNSSTISKCNTNGSVIETIPMMAGGSSLGKLEGIAIDHANQLLYVVTDAGQELLVYQISDPTLDIVDYNIEANEISVFPNPINESQILSIKINNYNQQDYSASIYNVNGQLLSESTTKKSDTTRINIEDLSAGLYFVTIKTNSSTVTKKIIKK